jgi:chromosome segregation protein
MPARLKSLELHGFKTFATRTEFAFAGLVTAIVGPNGSGKSNIADAIRWVLGEQSYGLLRAKKTEDMIFAGSEHRPRSGMASASILFDNSDGWLPIDFVEVEITRRAYRDGQNEYLLNGQRVRLRDVSELLAQSGLAERTYTIIGQGLVDAALALKAEDRRRLFEEAAGIGLYRSRREEALRRLETTRRNLDRVQDILAELQPRLRSLERQARRVADYEQVKADLRVLLREWYGYHWHRAQKELTDSQEAARTQDQGLEKSRIAQDELNQRLVAQVSKIQFQRIQLNTWHHRLAELHTERERLSRELVVSEERMRSITSQQQDADSEMIRLEEEAEIQESLVQGINLDVTRSRQDLEEAKSQSQNSELALKDKQKEREELEKAAQSARQEHGKLTGHQAHLNSRLADRKNQLERLIHQKEKMIVALSAAEQDLSKSQVKLDEILEKVKEATLIYQDRERILQEKRSQIERLEKERLELTKQQSFLHTSIARFKAQIDVLEQAEKSLVGYSDGSQYLLKAAQQSRLKGVLGSLSSQIEVPKEFEAAIAASLGDYLDAIVFDRPDSFEDALVLLDNSKTRGALLALDNLQISQDQGKLNHLLMGDQIIGVANQSVKTNHEYQSLVDLLLGKVIIVRNRLDAKRLVSQLQDEHQIDWRVVTLRGEVFHVSGPVFAGQERKQGILGRSRERRELQENLQNDEQAAASLIEKVSQIDADIQAVRTTEEQILKQYQDIAIILKKVNEQRNEAELGVEKFRRNRLWLQEQSDRLIQEIDQVKNDCEKIEEELNHIDGKIVEARQTLRERNTALAEITLDEYQIQLAHWNTRVAVSSQALEDATKRQKDILATLARIQKNLENLKNRKIEYKKQLSELKELQDQLRLVDKDVDEKTEALLVFIQPAEQELAELEQTYTSLQANEAEARQILSFAEHQNAQARINLARKQESLDSLRRRIEDDFGLVAFRYAESITGPTPLPLDGLVEQLSVVAEIPAELEENIQRQRAQLRRIGPVNPEVQAEYSQVKERFEFMKEQVQDLYKAEIDIKEVISELDMLMEREFKRTFDAVAHEFRQIFGRLFGGGAARLVLTTPENLTDSGIDIEARLPGRREQGLALLSGGERSLTAAALIFALLKVSPTPFCVLDEVDAMLDEANVGRFRELLRELSELTQFVVVTHNRNTVQAADVIYGVTMGPDSSSQVISLKLDEVTKVVN